MSVIVQVLLLLGCLLILLASVGAVKFPDTLTRMAAVSKSSTLGVVLLCAGAAVHFGDVLMGGLLGLAALVLFLGIPVSSYLMARVRVRNSRIIPLQLKRNDLQSDEPSV
ncbi:Na(+)/H(+) antiporter subunit G [Bdellovibrio bacteriovorus]|uniref:cation:proton antiporter n=1 Tax=Bdellovibrio bacteriovorus TaxID=959 RepID=UPI00045BF395|nr:monovalent cation/H(+) antiporter subunit G [Bdellovibrio bacteriovorus]AHZ84815.1 hypothetical protein EP01_07675 [Bdellovibrio bacteriovorus]BEV68701.1 Na(+)/H(+) antiporter subunit G [Bdellovibrio bacteriovorus]